MKKKNNGALAELNKMVIKIISWLVGS